MKQVYAFAIAFLLCLTSYSQETLVSRHGLQLGGFGGPILEFSDLNGNFGVSVGGGGGIMLNHFFLGGYGLASTHDILADIDAERYEVTLAHGGIWTGYDFSPHKLLHVTFSFRAGYGILLFGLEDDFSYYDFEDEIFTLTPEVGISLNLTRHVKLVGTVGQRWVRDVETDSYASDAFDSYVASFMIKFGDFNNRYHQR